MCSCVWPREEYVCVRVLCWKVSGYTSVTLILKNISLHYFADENVLLASQALHLNEDLSLVANAA